jgi:hypothetical protein
MLEMPIYFEIVVLLFKEEQRKIVRKKVSELYLSTYLDVGYKLVSEELASGWKIYSIRAEHFSIETNDFKFA